jgi:hypothetical protein
MDYQAEYSRFHENTKYFPGYTITRYVKDIANLVRVCSPRDMLDYGCGKGYQYLARRVHMQWGGLLPHCYDIGVRQLWDVPQQQFDALICTDVLEHIEEKDMEGFLINALSFLRVQGDVEHPFAFFSVSCLPSKHKQLSDGRNVHVTQKDYMWWKDIMQSVHREDVIYLIACETTDGIIYHIFDRTDGHPSAWGRLIDGRNPLENPDFKSKLSRETKSIAAASPSTAS